jgi:hypothetical protein
LVAFVVLVGVVLVVVLISCVGVVETVVVEGSKDIHDWQHIFPMAVDPTLAKIGSLNSSDCNLE